MKKRILSIALAIVMVVGMAATMLTGVSAYTFVDPDSFNTYVSENALVVDAQMDDVYRMSEQVSNCYTNYTAGTGSGFDSWTVATKNGLYVYAFVDDTTVGSEYMIYNDYRGAVNCVSNADKIQYYFQFTYTDSTSWWGYFEMDYYANNVDGENMVDNAITSAWGKNYAHARYKYPGAEIDTNTIPAGIEYASKILRDSNGDEYGWVAEFFIPFNVAGNVPATQEGIPATKIGVQVNNDDWSIDEGKTAFKDGWLNRKGYSYSRYVGTGWWTGDFSANPLTPLNFSETSFYDYDVFLTSQHVELDGKLDEVYLNSSRIDAVEQWSDNIDDVPFYSYVVATLNGIYVFADVEDTTMNNINNTDPANGEMVQIYLDWSPKGTAHTDPGVTFDTSATRGYNSVYGSWMGWFQADYDGNLSGSFDTQTQWLKDYGAKVAVQKHENPDWDGTDTKTQYVGYSIEFFIPYNDYMQHIVDTQNFADYHFSFGFQVNDDETYDSSENRTSIAYTAKGGSYWAHFEYLPEMRLVPEANLPKHAAGITVDTVTLDGKNTDGEYDKAQAIHVNLAGSGKGDDGDIYRVICDGNYVYVLMEMVDTTPTYSSTKGTLGYQYHDYNDVYIARYGSNDAALSGSYTSVHRASNDSNTKAIDNGTNGWSVEKRYAMTNAEKAAFAKGEFVFAVSMQYLDGTATASGRIYKYDNEQGGVFYGGSGNTYSQGYHKFVFAADSSKITPAFKGANVALGESIDVNYYVALGTSDTDAKVKFTFNDKVVYAGAQKTDILGEYKFVFEGLAPQCMGDNIKAELIVDGKVVDTKAEYSVLENLNNVKNEDNKALVEALLNYGAAAQQYAHYKTDTLVNAGVAAPEYATIVNSDRVVGTANVEGAKFTAAGVYHANANKIYAKVTLESVDALEFLTVTINGADAELELFDAENNVYIVYTDDIKVTGFDDVYTFVLSDGTSNQTLTYSVNAYCAAKQNAANANTAALANAMYAYGAAAEAYLAA